MVTSLQGILVMGLTCVGYDPVGGTSRSYTIPYREILVQKNFSK